MIKMRVVENTLRSLVQKTPYSRIHDMLHKDWLSVEKKVFQRQGGFMGLNSGEKWPKLDQRYKKWKDARYPGRKILVLSGSLVKAAVGEGPGHYFLKNGKQSWFGVDGRTIPYANRHNMGDGPNGNIPERQFIAVTPLLLTRWQEMVKEFFSKYMRGQVK
jgi:phage gpG-like protein